MNSLFGLKNLTQEKSAIVLLAVCWDVTASYKGGSSLGPQAILKASPQLDFCDENFGNILHCGIYLKYLSENLKETNNHYKELAQKIIQALEHQESPNPLTPQMVALQKEVNKACAEVMEQVYKQSLELLKKDKLVGLIGGDHSISEGFLRSLHEHHAGDFGVLHIDAHADLRQNYQGFKHSHASVMYNLMTGSHSPKKLVQVGIRDFCQEEKDFIKAHPKIKTFFNQDMRGQLFSGRTWAQVCEDIINELPEKVYISFDIDGLCPSLCPNTGTPVPGGFSFDEILFLLSYLKKHKKHIIGFDLVEVAPSETSSNEWDGNVGARILYQLCGWSWVCQN